MLNQEKYQAYCDILKQELLAATGCTEPIAIAYAAAIARKELGKLPQTIQISLSGNIIKNVKSVIVPGTNGAKGIEAALAGGIIAGCPEKKLEVLAGLTEEDKVKLDRFLKECLIEITLADDGHAFDIQLTATAETDTVKVRILDFHTNVVRIQKNETVILDMPADNQAVENDNRTLLNVEDIVTFADTVQLKEVQELIEGQIKYNMRIAREGIENPYGACIGRTLLQRGADNVDIKARALAAAGSDARMNGCELPVCIVSGSGNQGITTSVPVVVYAQELKTEHEKLIRALVAANLITIHQKTGIGRLSAYCGVISAGCGCGAGIAYLHGGGYDEISHTVVNAVAILSGTVCDGAKASCAAKIAMAVEAGILGFEMYQNGQQFYGGDGIITKGVEKTIENVSRLARIGMKETDSEIMKIMIGE
jgi:L-cysteine desulfidase